jgi:hypothetical protein
MNRQSAVVGAQTPDEQQHGLLGVVYGWISYPFNSSGSALNWLLILGILIIVGWFWYHVLLSILDE